MHAKLKNLKIKQILTAKACADRHVALSRAPPPPPRNRQRNRREKDRHNQKKKVFQAACTIESIKRPDTYRTIYHSINQKAEHKKKLEQN